MTAGRVRMTGLTYLQRVFVFLLAGRHETENQTKL